MYSFGQIDLTKLGDIVQKHPSLVRKVKFKDGREHKMLNISIFDTPTDKFGNTMALRVSCKPDDRVEGLNYYVANLKESEKDQPESHQSQQTPPPPQQDYYAQNEGDNDLPF